MSPATEKPPLIAELPTELLGLGDEGDEPTRIEETKKLGRYELVWELGTGGMASVYLARVRGPAGFNKWLAIKRIHPHLAKDTRFVEMFLDEARIAAAVHHPNVAHVFDLGDDSGERFLAMEYLHGEHLGTVAVRAVRERGRLEPEIAARIIASAADGLHHAHEARDAEGRHLGLVHRDVSPQNIFVTYDGSVKLTDFGIAKAAGRLTHTQTGGTKGKVSYMAPEQALGHAVDRRTDVWALGVVLWECTTGRRLFKGETDAQTLLRITSGHARSPSEVVPGYPPELERIVMRALAARPEQRYPTAAAMARELERWLATVGHPVGAPELSTLMKGLFGDRIGLKERILGGRAEETVLTNAFAAAAIATPSDVLDGEASESRVHARAAVAAPAAARRFPLWLAAPIALLIVALGAGSTYLIARPSESVVRIDTEPGGATIYLDGVAQPGRTPALLEHVPSGRHRLRLELAGRAPLTAELAVDQARVDLSYTLRMRERVAAAPPPRPSPPVAREPGDPAAVAPAAATTAAPAAPPEPSIAPIAAVAARPPPVTPIEIAPFQPAAPVAPTGPRVTRTRPGPSPRAAPAYLNLITRPWASISINGRAVGSTPLLRRTIPSGDLVVRLRAEGTGPARTIRLHAAPGETLSRSLDL